MRVQLSRPAYFALASSTAIVLTVRLLQWRARTRARKTVDRVKSIVRQDSPLVDVNKPQVRERIIERAARRASKWMTLSAKEAKPLVGQVGGASVHKKPLLSLQPEYVLKPLLTDHRGLREIAFYEAMEVVSKSPGTNIYSNFLRGSEAPTDVANRFGEIIDTLAVALAMILRDSSVMESESALKAAWKAVKREAEILHKVRKFTAPYYGLMGQRGVSASPDAPYGVTEEAHLLLQDLTINYSQPCVMDLKMGTETFEPDASSEKRAKESGKYQQQGEFGFRIVGMRIYDPTHAEADNKGYRFFGKEFGRSLSTLDQVRDALRIYFSAGVQKKPQVAQNGSTHSNKTSGKPQEMIRMKAVSNILLQIRRIRRWFEEENKSLRFCASSLLIVYEGDTSFGSSDVTLVKMIDFGRVRRQAGGDAGYSHGLRTFKTLLADLAGDDATKDSAFASSSSMHATSQSGA